MNNFPRDIDFATDIDWIDAKTNKPARPERPYETYLVWAVQAVPNATGTAFVWQFDRDANNWCPMPPGRTGARQVITHYSEILQTIGSPGPQPWGPRGEVVM